MAVEKAAAHGDRLLSASSTQVTYMSCILIYKEVRSKGKKGRKSVTRVFFSPLPIANMDFET